MTTAEEVATDRKAHVQVVNTASTTFRTVGLVHKYSDKYKDDHRWGKVPAKGHGEGYATVRFRTGFLTTGQDWWYLSLVDTDGNTYMTEPKNFREIFDWIENEAKDYFADVKKEHEVTGENETNKNEAAKALVVAIFDLMLNRADTAGFKKHYLEASDEIGKDDNGNDVLVRLIIGNKDQQLPKPGERLTDSLMIASPSGVSRTALTCKKP